jgi:hypothetical protein
VIFRQFEKLLDREIESRVQAILKVEPGDSFAHASLRGQHMALMRVKELLKEATRNDIDDDED